MELFFQFPVACNTVAREPMLVHRRQGLHSHKLLHIAAVTASLMLLQQLRRNKTQYITYSAYVKSLNPFVHFAK